MRRATHRVFGATTGLALGQLSGWHPLVTVAAAGVACCTAGGRWSPDGDQFGFWRRPLLGPAPLPPGTRLPLWRQVVRSVRYGVSKLLPSPADVTDVAGRALLVVTALALRVFGKQWASIPAAVAAGTALAVMSVGGPWWLPCTAWAAWALHVLTARPGLAAAAAGRYGAPAQHRGLSHWWGLPVAAGHALAFAGWLWPGPWWLAWAALFGWASHALGDGVFGKAGPHRGPGIPLAPWWNHRGVGGKSGGRVDTVFCVVVSWPLIAVQAYVLAVGWRLP